MNAHQKLPILTIVGGRPGTGKSTLAHLLAKRIHCPLISRDAIKEGIVNTLGDKGTPGGTPTPEAVATFFSVIELLLQNQVTLVADVFFPEESWRAHIDRLKKIATVNFVFCQVDVETASHRMTKRRQEDAQWDEFHNKPVFQKTMPSTRYEPPKLDIPLLIVDCQKEYDPDIESIFRFTKR